MRLFLNLILLDLPTTYVFIEFNYRSCMGGGASVAGDVRGGGACVAGGMHGRRLYSGGMHGRRLCGRGHVWQGVVCVAVGDACVQDR